MSSQLTRKTRRSRIELLAGGSIFLIGLPLILFTLLILLAGLAMLIGLILMFGTTGIGPAWWLMLSVDITLFAGLSYLSWRALRRVMSLAESLQSIQPEQERITDVVERDGQRLQVADDQDTALLSRRDSSTDRQQSVR